MVSFRHGKVTDLWHRGAESGAGRTAYPFPRVALLQFFPRTRFGLAQNFLMLTFHAGPTRMGMLPQGAVAEGS